MPYNALALHHSSDVLLDGITRADKDLYSQLAMFNDWLTLTGGTWYTPDLKAYRDWLMSDERLARNRHTRALEPARALTPPSVRVHLSTIRSRYQTIMADNAIRDHLYTLTSQKASAADRKAFVDEALLRLQNQVAPAKSSIELIKEQDVADAKHLRLTVDQANALLEAPLNDKLNSPLQAIRDTALIALALCTGVREMELCALNVGDLRQQLGGSLALQIRKGKGSKTRLIPYGALDWCLIYVEKWLTMAGISEGAVFRGFYKGGKRIRASRLTERAVQDILDRYPLNMNGTLRAINPHDLRRSYARRLYEVGVKEIAIQQNLGHVSLDTTRGYIGTLDADQRKPPSVFRPPHLKRLEAL
jgi:site-specific recombinase XerD